MNEDLWSKRRFVLPPAVTMAELYEQIAQFLSHLKSEPASLEDLREHCYSVVTQVSPVLTSIEGLPSALESQNLTLEMFRLGSLYGVGNGILMFHHRSSPTSLPSPTSQDELGPLFALLSSNLNTINETTSSQWPCAHIDDLHLLCGYGQQENLRTLEEAVEVVQECGSFIEFQRFLMATFKGGYAVGLAQTATVFLDGS